MNYLIIGAGAIGSYIGASLIDAGCKVAFLEKPEYAAHLKQGGLHVFTFRKELQFTDITVHESIGAALRDRVDVVVFAMKSFDTRAAAEMLVPYPDQFQAVLCLQNGVENEPLIGSLLGEEKVIGGSVTSAVSRKQAGQVALEKERGIGLENRGQISENLRHDFEAGWLHPQLYARRSDMKWSKMLSNLLGNATCAILDLSPAEVFADRDLFHLEMRQMKEALAVMRANGWSAVDLPHTPMGKLCLAIIYLPERISRPLLLKPLGGGRGNKMPSFHIDLHSGKKESEVGFLNGAVSRFGIKCGVKTPVNDTLTRVLLDLTENPERIAKYRHNKAALLAEIK
jgi:2-dehydropantoate 2-reductase